MPYVGERANPLGVEVLHAPGVQERLRALKPMAHQEQRQLIEALPKKMASALPGDSQDLTHLMALDGSLHELEDTGGRWSLGFVRVGVVLQQLLNFRTAQDTSRVTSQELDNIYRTYTLNGVLPGRGFTVGDGLGEEETLRRELYELIRTTPVVVPGFYWGDDYAPQDQTLLEVMQELVYGTEGAKTVKCGHCGKPQKTPYEEGRCMECYRHIYFTDVLELTNGGISRDSTATIYNGVMSTLERLVTMGLLKRAAERAALKGEASRTAFVVDGPLSLFQARALIGPLRDYLQQHGDLILAGVEKTGIVPRFASAKSVVEGLQPGEVAMVTKKVYDRLRGGSHKQNFYYGRHFLYRLKDDKRIFVFTMPPLQGDAYSGEKEHEVWENFPHLGCICGLIEETHSDGFSFEVPALTAIARANHTASIPRDLGAAGERLRQEIQDRMREAD